MMIYSDETLFKMTIRPTVTIAATAVTIHGGGGHIYDYQFDLNEKTQSHRELRAGCINASYT
jgi:hypothetical protein